MILIGTMDWASTRLKGMFHCPNCDSTQRFRLRASRPFLTFYFIPVIPIGGLQEFVQCTNCKNAFESIVLANHMLPNDAQPQPQQATVETSFEEDLLKVLALVMVEDGHVTENEIRIARRLFENMTEQNLSRDALGAACSQVRLHRLNTTSFLSTAASRCSHEQKLLLVQAMFGVAGADGELSSGRMKSLVRSQQLLNLDQQEFETAVEATSQWLQ